MDANARHTHRIIATLTFLILLAPLGAPLVQGAPAAPSNLDAGANRSVGTFDVTPAGAGQGRAQGSLVSSILAEAGADATGTGVLKDFSVGGADAPDAGSAAHTVFSAIDMQGFSPSSQLQGVGTSSLSMKNDNLLVTLMDNVNSLLTIKATGADDQLITFHTPADVLLSPDADAQNVWRVAGQGANAAQGAIVLLRADQNDSAKDGSNVLLSGQHTAQAKLKQGAQLVFRSDTSYANKISGAIDQGATAYNTQVVNLMASGKLVGEATTEFSAGAQLIAQAQYHAFAQAHTEIKESTRVTTTLKSTAAAEGCAAGDAAGSALASAPGAAGSATGSASGQACARAEVLAYDLDYVDVPAQTADSVAVYVDGALAQRVAAASDVATHANSYWAWAVDGRVLVVTNVAAKVNAATQVTIAALAQGQAAASTLAQLDAASALTYQLQGGFSMLGDLETSAAGSGQVIGSFSEFFASEAKGDTSVRHFTDVRSSQEIFTKIEVMGDIAADAAAQFTSRAQLESSAYAQGSAQSTAGAAVLMTTTVAGQVAATTEFTDSVYGAIQTEADLSATENFHLSNDISAHALADAANVVELDGPAGKVGYLILTGADGTAAAHSQFDLSKTEEVQAKIAQGEKLVFRSTIEAQGKASANLLAKAIANGALGGEASVGYVANAIASAHVDYQKNFHTAIKQGAETTHRGLVTLDAVNEASASAKATAVALVADQATLAARSASDIAVTVNGKAAVAVGSAAEALAATSAEAGAQAKYWVGTSQGLTQVIVLVPYIAAGEAASIVAKSNLDVAARAAAALDTFGEFVPGYGGAEAGKIVSLVAKPDAGLVLDYTVAAKATADAAAGTTTKVFDSVRLGGASFSAGSGSSPSSLKWVGPEGTLEAFDVSEAVLKATAAQSTNAAFDLASNVQPTQVDDHVIMLNAPDFSGALIAIGNGALQTGGAAGGQVSANLDAGATVMFKAFSGFESELNSAQKQAQAEAIASGKLMGQVIVQTDAATHATTSAVINYYGNVMAVTQVATTNQVQIVIDSATHSGKSIILSLDRNTVSGLIHGDAKLMVDGHELSQASSYQDALVPNADKYYLITTQAEAGLQAIVTLAHFSTRTITLSEPSPPSVFLWSTIGLAVIVVGQVVYPRLRRKAD